MKVQFHVYSSADAVAVELFVNGVSAGRKRNEEWMGWTEWNVSWAAGNVTVTHSPNHPITYSPSPNHTPYHRPPALPFPKMAPKIDI